MPQAVSEELQRLTAESEGLAQTGRHTEAIALAQRACELVRERLGATHPALAECLLRLADLHVAAGDLSAAELLYVQALELLHGGLEELRPGMGRALAGLARVSALLRTQSVATEAQAAERSLGLGWGGGEAAPPAPAPAMPPPPRPTAPAPRASAPSAPRPAPGGAVPESAALSRKRKTRGKTSLEPATLDRKATVRYYRRMNPKRIYQLLVVLSSAKVRPLAGDEFAQASSERFAVPAGTRITVEPVLPGCACYPPRREVVVRADEKTEARFHVLGDMEGEVPEAHVQLSSEGSVLARVPLAVQVGRPWFAWALGVLSPVVPSVLKYFQLDLDTLSKEKSPVQMLWWLMALLADRPWVPALVLLAGAVAVWWWLRPRPAWSWDVEMVPPGTQGTP